MDVSMILAKVDCLASGKEHNNFTYDDLISIHEGKSFLAAQIALAHCYKYEFNFELAQKANLFGNVEFYQFRAKLEQDFKNFIQINFLAETKAWDITKPAKEYVSYLERLICEHSSFHHKFFTEFLPKTATKEDLRFYLAQESAPRFDDLLALIQIGCPLQMKMELARNYWDEMGNGNFSKVHAAMFSKLLENFNVTPEFTLEKALLSSLVSDNLSAMLSIYRENYAHAIGFLAVTEYCVPRRFKSFIEGGKRLGIQDDILSYHILHTDIDGEHAIGWFQQIVVPLIEKNPHLAKKITEGAILKLNSSQYFFDGILKKLSSPLVSEPVA
jgi:hypothetical protein